MKKLVTTKLLLGVILLLVITVIALLFKKDDTPKTELDCVKLGSNERTALCLKLLATKKVSQDFPLAYLQVENPKAGQDMIGGQYGCLQAEGILSNTYSEPTVNVQLRIDFSKTQNGTPFHYEVFSPFDENTEQIQPNSRKAFSKCFRLETVQALRDIKQWYFTITPFSAQVYEK